MSEKSDNPEDLLEESGNSSNSLNENNYTEEELDEFYEENYEQLEALVRQGEERLGKKNRNVDTKNLMNEDEKKQKQNWLRSREHRMELGEELKDLARKERPHFLHPQGAAFLGYSITTLGFVSDKMFFQIGLLGLIYAFKDSFTFQERSKFNSRLPKLINHHPIAYIVGAVLAVLVMLGAGYSFPAELHMGLVADILTNVLLAMLGA